MILHQTYLPFEEDVLKQHFIATSEKDRLNQEQHLNYYKKSIERFKEFETAQQPIPKERVSTVRQIEKDEKFWTASTYLTFFYSSTRNDDLIKMLQQAFGPTPPLHNFNHWEECLSGELHMFFEPNLPSPKSYLNWLKNNLIQQNLIPYVIENAQSNDGTYRTNLEGATNVDALLLNATNGFAVVIEAKVLSDISYQVSYDLTRNQIIRNIDVMLDVNENLNYPLKERIPENTLFLLTTPELFKINPHTRLYGYKFHDYKNKPEIIAKELPHRTLTNKQASDISKRIGWLSWEELKRINNNCCKWLQ